MKQLNILRKFLVGFLALLLIMSFIGCSKEKFEIESTTTGLGNPENRVTITSAGYSKIDLWVGKDIPVTWINGDNKVHTVTAENGTFDSGPIQPGASYTRTFTVVGSYTYFDRHSSATGVVNVFGREGRP